MAIWALTPESMWLIRCDERLLDLDVDAGHLFPQVGQQRLEDLVPAVAGRPGSWSGCTRRR